MQEKNENILHTLKPALDTMMAVDIGHRRETYKQLY